MRPPAALEVLRGLDARPFAGSIWIWSSVIGIAGIFMDVDDLHHGVVVFEVQPGPADGRADPGRDLDIKHLPVSSE